MSENEPKQPEQETSAAIEARQPQSTAGVDLPIQETRARIGATANPILAAKRKVQEGEISLLDYVRARMSRRLIPRLMATLEVLAEPDDDNKPEELSAKEILDTLADYYARITNPAGRLRQDIAKLNKAIAGIGLQIKQRVNEIGRNKENLYSLTWID